MDICTEDFPPIKPVDTTTYLKEQLVFLYFHLTRKSSDTSLVILEKTLSDVLEIFKKTPDKYLYERELYLRLVLETRSVISDKFSNGKGEKELTYMMIFVWYQYFPELTNKLLSLCFTKYGSWCDVPYLCEYIRKKTTNKYHSLINIIIHIANTQLHSDMESWKFSKNAFSRNHISSIAKWIPRENKKLDWLHSRMAFDWAKKHHFYVLDTAVTDSSYEKAMKKCCKLYRKTYSCLNKALNTPQIKQCSRNSSDIDPKNVSPVTEIKQRRTLTRTIQKPPPPNIFNGSRIVIPLSYFIKEAFRMISSGHSVTPIDIDRLNKQWDNYSKTISKNGFNNMLPLIDVSWYMQEAGGEAFYSAIGLGLLVAERSSIGKRIMAYGSNSTWINLENDPTFFTMVENIYQNIQSIQNTTSNIESALLLIHNAIQEVNNAPFRMENEKRCIKTDLNGGLNKHTNLPKLIIFSNNFEGLDTYIMPVHQKIICWNVSTNMNLQLPCAFNKHNYILLSGLSGGLLSNLRLLKRYSKNKTYAPYYFIEEMLSGRQPTISPFQIKWIL